MKTQNFLQCFRDVRSRTFLPSFRRNEPKWVKVRSILVSFERLLDVNSNTQHRYSLAISVKWNLEMVDIAHTKWGGTKWIQGSSIRSGSSTFCSREQWGGVLGCASSHGEWWIRTCGIICTISYLGCCTLRRCCCQDLIFVLEHHCFIVCVVSKSTSSIFDWSTGTLVVWWSRILYITRSMNLLQHHFSNINTPTGTMRRRLSSELVSRDHHGKQRVRQVRCHSSCLEQHSLELLV